MANVLDCCQEVSEFELQSYYYVNFWINTFGKGMEFPITPAISLILSLMFFYKDRFGIK